MICFAVRQMFKVAFAATCVWSQNLRGNKFVQKTFRPMTTAQLNYLYRTALDRSPSHHGGTKRTGMQPENNVMPKI